MRGKSRLEFFTGNGISLRVGGFWYDLAPAAPMQHRVDGGCPNIPPHLLLVGTMDVVYHKDTALLRFLQEWEEKFLLFLFRHVFVVAATSTIAEESLLSVLSPITPDAADTHGTHSCKDSRVMGRAAELTEDQTLHALEVPLGHRLVLKLLQTFAGEIGERSCSRHGRMGKMPRGYIVSIRNGIGIRPLESFPIDKKELQDPYVVELEKNIQSILEEHNALAQKVAGRVLSKVK